MKMPMYVPENSHVDNGVACSANNPPAEPPYSQTVGREFVRQYYTMFGSGPKYVHRFYGSESVFFRDEVEIIGQQAIEKHIERLNLKDCHTKIRAVDTHSTIGDGFVVQVIGEISINGCSFRQFVQTFVLAPQSKKKYYVHNDTFRYLDDFIGEIRNTEHHETATEGNQTDQPLSNMFKHVVSSVNGNSNGEDKLSEEDSAPLVAVQVRNFIPSSSSTSSLHSQQQIGVGETSSWVPPQSAASDEGPPLNHSSAEHFRELHSDQLPPGFDTSNESLCVNGNGRAPSVDKTNADAPEEIDEQQNGETAKQQSTWASRVGSKTGNGVGGGYTQQPGSFPSIQSTQNILPGQNLVPNKYIQTSYAAEGFKPPPITVQAGNAVRPFESNRTSTSASNAPVQRTGSFRGKLYEQNCSIEQQVFVGNLPMDVKDSEVHEKLCSYGKILNVSVVSKQAVSPYAFVTFESAESVVKLLEFQNLPNPPGIFVRNNRITIEKKRGVQTDSGRYQIRGDSTVNPGMPRMAALNQRGVPPIVSRMPYGGGGRGGGPFTRPNARTFSRNSITMGNNYGGGGGGGGGNMMPK